MVTPFLPMTLREMRKRGWDQADIILISGDAYLDHPACGIAIIARSLEAAGFRVALIAQPDWHSAEDFRRLGAPRLYFGISAGSVDSMVAHYTPALKKRRDDHFTAGGHAGKRPNRAAIVYANRCREAFAKVPLVLGGIEASLRRFSHYDYWSDSVKRSILLDSRADILVYGNGELQAVEIAQRLQDGEEISHIRNMPGTVVRVKDLPANTVCLPSHREVSDSKKSYARMYKELAQVGNKAIAQPAEHWFILQNPRREYHSSDLDQVYALPFTRLPHPSYSEAIPGWATIRNSLQSHRGCFGGCSFCAIYFHEGKNVVSRSPESILQEVESIAATPHFRGTIDNIGGPTANMYKMSCKRGGCTTRISCLFPDICGNLESDHAPWIGLLRQARKLPGIKHVFVESGVRHDLLLRARRAELREFCAHHIGGQLKLAPEHSSPKVLRAMHKPPFEKYLEFVKIFSRLNAQLNKKQFIVPYLMSSHPGCGLRDMIALAQHLQSSGHFPEQVQDFTPTPMTLATCMFYTGIEPLSGKPISVARHPREKRLQRALLHYRDPAQRRLVYEALEKAGRLDLVGRDAKCLLRSAPNGPDRSTKGSDRSTKGSDRSTKGSDRSTKGSDRSTPKKPPKKRRKQRKKEKK